MNKKIEQMRRTYETGEPLYRLSNAASTRTILTDTLTRLDETLARARDAFASELSRWQGTECLPQRPFEIAEQVRKARFAASVGWTLLAAEVVLTILLSVAFDVNPAVAAVLAVALPAGIAIGTAVLCECRPNPLETERRIQWYVLLPGLIVLLLSALVLTAARTFAGPLAAGLSSYVSISLWTLSLGLAITSSSVLALANLWGWSVAAVRRYTRAETSVSMYRAELARVTVIETKLSSTAAAAIVGVLLLSLIACGGVPAARSAAAAPVSSPTELELDIYVDRSCSPADDELRSTLDELQRQLPSVVVENGITRVNYLAFAEDGFGARIAASADMPAIVREPEQAESEAAVAFGTIRAETQRASAQKNAARREEYRTAVAAALSQISVPPMLGGTCATSMSKCTDVAGVMERARMRGDQRIAIVLTDLEETCGKPPLQPVVLGSPAVILVLPSKVRPAPRRALSTFNDARESSALLALGAVVGPWFAAADLPALVFQARNARRSPRDRVQRGS
jgi:hypothetical protein